MEKEEGPRQLRLSSMHARGRERSWQEPRGRGGVADLVGRVVVAERVVPPQSVRVIGVGALVLVLAVAFGKGGRAKAAVRGFVSLRERWNITFCGFLTGKNIMQAGMCHTIPQMSHAQ